MYNFSLMKFSVIILAVSLVYYNSFADENSLTKQNHKENKSLTSNIDQDKDKEEEEDVPYSGFNFGDFISPNHFDFGFSLFNLDYKETLELPKKSTESGWIPGYYISTSTNTDYPYKLTMSLFVSSATENYNGSVDSIIPVSLKDTIVPYSTDTKSKFTKFDITGSYKFDLNPEWNFTPFLEVSFRSWDRSLQGPYGYEELYSWDDLTGGLAFNVILSRELRLNFNIAVSGMIYGNMNVEGMTFTLGKEMSEKIGASLIYWVNHNISLTFNPYYEHYEYGMSNVLKFYYPQFNAYRYVWEPSSKTNLYGFNLGVILRFH